MIVEDIIGDAENFPAGMRVLAVDDDPICLKLLDTLLTRCNYNVTSTNKASIAINMIRENRDGFDLVLCDVHMPDIDGFKLLELVGLKMDLPVIMLSANSDPKLVMKGVTHGACDYLVKPIRIEELRNIWQHVIRRNQFDSTNQNRSSGEGRGSPLAGNTDEREKPNRKRNYDKNEIEDNGNKCDPGARNRTRVIWTLELHNKFVAAVSHLGIEKAVPKIIVEMMNVEGLTRENVASHLQKYRLYLKRISIAAAEQANTGAARVGAGDSRFMHTGSSPIQAQNSSNSINSLGTMHPVLPTSKQGLSFLGGNNGTALGSSSNGMQHVIAQQPLNGVNLSTPESFNKCVSVSTNLLDTGRGNGKFVGMHPNPLLSAKPFHRLRPDFALYYMAFGLFFAFFCFFFFFSSPGFFF